MCLLWILYFMILYVFSGKIWEKEVIFKAEFFLIKYIRYINLFEGNKIYFALILKKIKNNINIK